MLLKLKDITTLITKGTTPSTLGFSFENTGINFIKSEQLISQRCLKLANKFYITVEAYNKLKRSQLQENDILMSIAGAYLGKLAIVSKKVLPANTNQAVSIIRVNTQIVHPLYVYYYLSTTRMRNIICSYNAQSAQPNINLNQISNLEIEVPSLEKQSHIVNTISFLLLKFL